MSAFPSITHASKINSTPIDPTFIEGEVVIKYKTKPSSRLLNTNLKKEDVSKINFEIFKNSRNEEKESVSINNNIALIKLKENETVKQKIEELKNDPQIEFAEPNFRYKLFSLNINDPEKTYLWGLEKIGMNDVWQEIRNQTGSTTVAVIDTGVVYTHDDIKDRMWDGTNCIDEYGNPLNNCVHGYDFADNDKDPMPIADTPSLNDGIHGTHIAGTIGAIRNNNIGIAGITDNVKTMALRSDLSSIQVVRAIDFARINCAKVINASFGGPGYSSAIESAITSFPGLFIAAAGNDGSNNETINAYPCNYNVNNIICVATTDQNDNMASFSSYGSTTVDIAAPGVSIKSLYPLMPLSAEPFGTLIPPNIPANWTREGNLNNWHSSTTQVSGQNITHLYADYQPYVNNASSSIIRPEINLNDVDYKAAQVSFGIRCETPSSQIF